MFYQSLKRLTSLPASPALIFLFFQYIDLIPYHSLVKTSVLIFCPPHVIYSGDSEIVSNATFSGNPISPYSYTCLILCNIY